ncbi:hypothetical protein L3X38_045152 [Prunus dulcis]|uniref:Uncharacterized protein n=1 Tax=Prunus dulcis TaxID=3755 RepID=A0AAD4V1U8_PRUDU|nr:hypothetical protein L3X38_045152 [Prunus dulcis]
MALLRPPKENTPPHHNPVEPPPPMIELFLYSIVSDYEDREYFNYMMTDELRTSTLDMGIRGPTRFLLFWGSQGGPSPITSAFIS